MFRVLFTSMMLTACTNEPLLEGQVLDVWEQPIEGAMVVMADHTERPLTDSAGRFSLPYTPGKHKIKAGREGYIQDHMEVELAEEPVSGRITFTLYPKPKDAGFYAVGGDDYQRLEPIPISQVGADLEQYRGIESVGNTTIDATPLRVVFHTPLKRDQVSRLDLELYQLDVGGTVPVTGPTGVTEVPLNLYIAKNKVDFELVPLRSRSDYLLKTEAALEPGTYAFTTQAMLSSRNAEAFREIPEPLRVAYAFQVR